MELTTSTVTSLDRQAPIKDLPVQVQVTSRSIQKAEISLEETHLTNQGKIQLMWAVRPRQRAQGT
jgi:hypothetical protein